MVNASFLPDDSLGWGTESIYDWAFGRTKKKSLARQSKMTDDKNPNSKKSDLDTSDSLLSRARDHDPQAWVRVVKLYTPLIDYWIRQRGIRGHDVENVRQEVFARLAKSIVNFTKSANGGSFRGYLRTITENLIRSLYRKDQVEATGGTGALAMLHQIPGAHESFSSMFDSFTGESAKQGGFYSIENGILFRRIMNWVYGNCSQQHTDVFTRVVLENKTPRDVAQDLNISVGSVYQTKSRILSSIREEFSDLV